MMDVGEIPPPDQQGKQSHSGRGDVPDIVDAVARNVTRFGVFRPSVKWLALIGPLLPAVVARHDGPVAGCLGVRICHERRPVGGARPIAIRFPRCVLLEHTKRHALCIDKRLAFRGIGAFGWCHLRQGWCRKQKDRN